MSSYRPIPLDFERLPPPEMIERAHRYAEAMQRRRTVREFSSEPIPDEIVVDAIRAAASAPSGAHQQPWTFVVIGDRTGYLHPVIEDVVAVVSAP